MNKMVDLKKCFKFFFAVVIMCFMVSGILYAYGATENQGQDDRRVIAPGWSNGNFRCSTYKFGTQVVPWKEVEGKPYHYEFVAGENVDFPFYATIGCAIHYKTRAYLEGKEIFMPGPNELFKKKLKFTAKKKYYDFMIDPGTSLDNETQRGVKTYFRVRVTGGKSTDTDNNITGIKAGKNKIKIKWAGGNGKVKYQIAYKKEGSGTWKNVVTDKRQVTLKNLKSKKYYYIKLRTVKKSGGKNTYGSWSPVKKIKVK